MISCFAHRKVERTWFVNRSEKIDLNVKCVVEHFSEKPLETEIDSESFSSGIKDYDWSLNLKIIDGLIELYLVAIANSTLLLPIVVQVEDISFRNSEMKVVVFEKGPRLVHFYPDYFFPAYIIGADLQSIRNGSLLPSDELHVHCTIRYIIKPPSVSGEFDVICSEFNSDSPKGTVRRRFEDLFNGKMSSSDVDIHVKEMVFKAHKIVLLASGSPVLNAMFEHPGFIETETNSWKIEDCKPRTVKEMLRYLYTDRVENFDEDLAMDLLVLANKYLIDPLKFHCELYLCGSIIIDNVSQLLAFAHDYSASSLKRTAMNFIGQNYRVVKETEGFIDLTKSHPNLGFELMDAFMVS